MKTREEAVKWLEETIQDTDTYWESCSDALQKELDEQKEVFLVALTALRPVSREQVEKVWNGCTYCMNDICSLLNWKYGLDYVLPNYKFCPMCGRPLTDEAVQMVMERLEALKDGKGD